MKLEKIIQIANELINKLKSRVSVIRVYAYGSQVRDEEELGSDLDFLVQVKEVNSYIKRCVRDTAWELSLEEEVVISVVVMSEDDFQNNPVSVSGLVQNVKQEGIEIAA